jgi:hypothetical protein
VGVMDRNIYSKTTKYNGYQIRIQKQYNFYRCFIENQTMSILFFSGYSADNSDEFEYNAKRYIDDVL